MISIEKYTKITLIKHFLCTKIMWQQWSSQFFFFIMFSCLSLYTLSIFFLPKAYLIIIIIYMFICFAVGECNKIVKSETFIPYKSRYLPTYIFTYQVIFVWLFVTQESLKTRMIPSLHVFFYTLIIATIYHSYKWYSINSQSLKRHIYLIPKDPCEI